MKQSLKWIGFVLFATFIGLALSVVFITRAGAQSPVTLVQRALMSVTPLPIPNTGWGGNGMMGPGMMGNSGGWGMGSGMHPQMMGGYGGWDYDAAPQGTPAPVDEELQLVATDLRFNPATITVKAGEAVRLIITNKDNVPHNLYSPEVPIAYHLIPARATQAVSFTAPTATGTYLAACTFHSGMTLEIVVK